ncbi:MAG: lysoplasmalogenase family protein, partial [Anaerolineales bacterium]
MSYFGLALALAGLNWLAIARNQKWLEYVTKPAVILALLAWLWLTIGLRGALPWFALGLLFSLIGDVLLMLPRERFLGGLAAFLLAQLAYIVGFNSSLPPITLAGVLLAALVGLGASAIYRRIRGGIPAKLKLPVGAYLCVI